MWIGPRSPGNSFTYIFGSSILGHLVPPYRVAWQFQRTQSVFFFFFSARYFTLGLSYAAKCHPWKRKVSLFSDILLNVNGPQESWATVSTLSLVVSASLQNVILIRCPFSETLLNVNGSQESLSGSSNLTAKRYVRVILLYLGSARYC